MRRLAVAQLGSYGVLDETKFVGRVVDYAIRVSTPKALRIAADRTEDTRHRDALRAAANRCENEGTRESADAAAYAGDVGGPAASAARDKSLSEYAEAVVQILIEMKAPGCQWLALTY